MYLYLSLLAEIGVAVIFILLLWLILSKARNNRIVKIRDASLTCEELEDHARKIAIEHSVGRRSNILNWPIPRMNDNYNFILNIYKSLNEDVQKKLIIPSAAEWLLDNFYIIEEQVKGIRRELLKSEYVRLPVLKCGPLKDYARIYAVAVELVAHIDGQIDENILLSYLKAYQSHSILSDREIWALPVMIRLALIENIRNICEKVKDTQVQWRKADEIIDIWLADDGADTDKIIKSVKNIFRTIDGIHPSFVEHLIYRLRRTGQAYNQILRYIDDSLHKFGTKMENITQKEHNFQAVSTVSMGNSVISLKFVSTFDWVDIFEATSAIEQILKLDPDGTYPVMDFHSRNYYRRKIEELALTFGVSELHIAKEVIELASNSYKDKSIDNSSDDELDRRMSHIGYYLIGKGSKSLENKLGFKTKPLAETANIVKNYPLVLYLSSIFLITVLLVVVAVHYTLYIPSRYHLLLSILAGIAVLVPSSEIAVSIVNWIICNVQKPAEFPRLELKSGIPEDLSTVIVIPALLPDEKRVKELLENLERHYLANKEHNLYFALLGDFKDSYNSTEQEDEKIINAGIEGIKGLNKMYSGEGIDLFYFFHRKRKFNEKSKKWMGWERKRGALIEFSHMLLDSDTTSFTYASVTSGLGLKIKYVITLDADTILPIGMAKKMIGTIAHTLNRTIIDKNRKIVTDGYGLIQPRVAFDIESANRSLFSRIFTGQEGIDPYASSISDVYQDFFSEGIFTGKGIYDLNVFQKVLENAFPENAILSHDLLEGSYIRAGLVTDLELIDSYPSRYNSYIARLHRWVRGDWQLLPWLGGKVYDSKGNRIKNPLSLVSRWKIFDNLRRSLVSPALMLLIILGFSILPGSSLFWVFLSLFALVFPLITATIGYLFSKKFGMRRIKRHIPVISGLKATSLQVLLMFIFLPFQAYLMISAIAVTLVRVFFTKKNMLEWVTAADVEKGQKNTLESYWGKMKVSGFIAVIVGVSAFIFKYSSFVFSLALMLIWIAAPIIAYYVSKTYEVSQNRLSHEDIIELRRIARKTWRYFEEFANIKNNYLVPDNYQEDPHRGIAYRTSSTNIGLGLLAALTARDLGYIGIYEMTDQISNIVNTIEKMEKWNGHLYNWYDTRTLRPLRPRYISTVDSGNLVCYLITLLQGMKEYMHRPFIDAKFVDGIIDTFSLIDNDASGIYKQMKSLREAADKNNIDITIWNKALNVLVSSEKVLNIKKLPWKVKAERMIRMFKKELSEFTSWADFIDTIPPELQKNASNERIEEAMVEILESLISNIPLKDLPDFYRDVSIKIDNAVRLITEIKDDNHVNALKWLNELKNEIAKSIENTEKFLNRYNELLERIKVLSDNTEFSPLYVEKKQLFSIGYNIEENRLTNSYYDLLASEARQTSYIAIARGEVPLKHWFKLGRALTVVDYYKGLVSWTGTMFEYLMPLLIMKSYKNTLLDETYSFVLRSQKKYGRQRGIPWGASESGFYSLDICLDYQYKAIGVPWLGLKRGLIEDAVATPYATFLALLVDPEGAMENIKRLKSEGLDGPYGFYEAVDYTPERLPFGAKSAIVKSFMAHHEGMSLLSLNCYLNNSIMQKRFHADPVVKAAQLLLQEKVPPNIVFTKETKEKVMPFKNVAYKEKGPVRKFKTPDFSLPKTHILSNGGYSIMITDKGTGYSKTKTLAVSRWREDSVLDNYGMFFYVRNTDTNSVWSTTYAPLNTLPEKYEVTFMADKVKFRRSDGDIETESEIVVTSGDNAEIRRISLKNHGQTPYVLEVTSYFEVVLALQAADLAHPAFSNLFIKTEFLPDRKCIIANRRSRSETEKSMWIANTAVVEGETVGDVQFETDRMQFIGRGHNASVPSIIAGTKPLSNTIGPVLDPIMSLRIRVKVDPGKTAKISFITAVGESNEILFELIEKYSSPEAVEGAFRLALTRSQVETRYLNIKASEIELYQELISHIMFISPLRRLNHSIIEQNRKGQSALWTYGISGDLPIVMVSLRKSDEVDMLYEVLKMHEYWQIKDLRVDLVILNDEENSYTHPLHTLLADIVSSSHAHETINKPGGVFILNRNNLSGEITSLLYAVARMVFKGDGGALADQVKRIQNNQMPKAKQFLKEPREYEFLATKEPELNYFNGLGGFTLDGKEYVILLEKGQNTPAPWVNVISNPDFGFLVSESGSGYTWCENSRENKLSTWSNDPVTDSPGEVFYLDDNDTGELWTIVPLPIREDEKYIIRHGFGYSKFEHNSHGIEQSMVQFVPVNEAVKITIIKLKNASKYPRNLTITYYIKPVLGVSGESTAMHIKTGLDPSGTLLLENSYNEEFAGKIAFVDVSEKERNVTGDRKEFFGKGGISYPEALKHQKLSGTVGIGYDPCAAMQISINLEIGEQKEIVFLFGMHSNANEISNVTLKYKSVLKAKEALAGVKKFWEEKVGVIRVGTPDSSMNIMLNGWLVYQVISCRMWGRSAFYQSGGAFGFRDQLQDCLSVAQLWPEVAREQIILHSKHQFVEGDVQHWWHEPEGKGTRTRFSDDLLWLPYVTSEYIRITGDYKILETVSPFLEDELLSEFEDERYSKPKISQQAATLYDHCIRTIERALKMGRHGLPLMGSGDWNDGMNTVGNGGKGESVWLGWFLYSILIMFSPICNKFGDDEKAKDYLKVAEKLSNDIDEQGWDGNWYRRAYFDSGIPLGSVQNSECKIDSIAQAWAVISGAGNPQKTVEAMNSLENYLVQREEGLIKLLTPPFDEGDLEPGYIKSYVPGVRENGGQYTHAAAWVIIAFAMLGDGDKAWELFELINPINHTRTHIEYSKYKVEPYVMAADVYAVYPHIGRGGWTWYTGSAGWIYRAGLEYILGFRKNGEIINIDPCIPKKWTEYNMEYKYLDTLYEIKVKNPEAVSRGVSKILIDGKLSADNGIPIINDGAKHFVEVYLGKKKEM